MNASKDAKKPRVPIRYLVTVISENKKVIKAAVANRRPIVWAKRLGGPGTDLTGLPKIGTSTFVANSPSGLRVGPVSTLATKP